MPGKEVDALRTPESVSQRATDADPGSANEVTPANPPIVPSPFRYEPPVTRTLSEALGTSPGVATRRPIAAMLSRKSAFAFSGTSQ